METQRVLVLDGHDGSGKTTLAQMVSDCLCGRVVKPFVDKVAEKMVLFFDNQQFEQLNVLTQEAVKTICHENFDAAWLIFDRHWLTMYSLLPEEYFGQWEPRPKTFLCWTDPETTLQRVTARGEIKRNTLAYHQYYCSLFKKLAEKFALPLINTSVDSPQKSLKIILSAIN